MIRSLYFIKRGIVNSTKSSLKFALHSFQNLAQFIFSERKLLFVTNQQIRTVRLTTTSQIVIMLFVSWGVSSLYSSMQYNSIISQKSDEISRLKSVTSYYETEFDNLNEKLDEVSNYMSSVITIKEKDEIKNTNEEQSLNLPSALKTVKISDDELRMIKKLSIASKKMDKVSTYTNSRIKKIEKILFKTGLKIGNSELALNTKNNNGQEEGGSVAQGGPYVPLENYSAAEIALKNLSDFKLLDSAKFSDKIKRLMSLERLVKFLPLSKPINKDYISSSFGPRVDPITKKMAMHQGIDFVGSKSQEIFSPSTGKVIRAGKYYDYGNVVEIDHGYGITSRYGHLSKVLVDVGQIVNNGDIIGLQGSTGRSTGEHLHYEIRHKGHALNPYKFIKAGKAFFQDNKIEAAINLETL